MQIYANFDSGNIDILGYPDADTARLKITMDAGGEFFQWFHFRTVGVKGRACSLAIENAGQSSYTRGWEGYRACASYDRETWFRVDAGYEDGVLTIRHTPEFDAVYYAYFAPYSRERHRDLIARCLHSPLVRAQSLGQTLDGEELDLLEINNPDATRKGGKRVVWCIGRQHPGETMAEWWMEGLLGRLLDPADPVARAALERASFFVVPNMNPDGSRRGHLRTNASGANLNREWEEPTMERSPEVFLTRQKMLQTGLDVCLDVHGDEALPYNFIAGSEGIPSFSDTQDKLLQLFRASLMRANPDFQTSHGYPAHAAGKANMTMCTNWTAEQFGSLSMTLEMPFKDNADAPDRTFGWSPQRSAKLGMGCLDALYAVLLSLEAD